MRAGSRPLSISLAPKHKITIFGLSPRDQSTLDRPFLEVFPEILAFMNVNEGLLYLKFLVNSDAKFSF